MTRHLPILLLASVLGLLGCGGGSLDVTEAAGDTGSPGSNGADAAATDAGIAPGPTADAGSANGQPGSDDAGDEADAEMIDMGDSYMPPTMNVPQSGPTVGQQVQESCSTASVKGLSTQLIEQMNCLEPGIMKSFAGAPDISYGGAVFPFMQGPATDSFANIAATNAGTLPVTSATRTIPQQYLLYRWYQLGLCNANLAASPGRSNHNGGLAIDIGDYGTWAPRMRQGEFDDNVGGEPWHFYFFGAGGEDIRNLSVLAFQQLHNLNFPEDPITEDGLYGPQTEGALQSAPANGFAEPPYCPSTRSLQAFPWRVPVETQVEQTEDGWLVQTIVPSGVDRVDYWLDGELVATVDRSEHPHFGAELDGSGELVVVATSSTAAIEEQAAGWLAEDGFFIRPFDVGLFAAGWSGEDEIVVTFDELRD